MPQALLRRQQLGLKQAAAGGDECPDGQKPAKAKRGRKPKAKADPKVKASPKGKAKAKASGKAKAKKDSEKTVPAASSAAPKRASKRKSAAEKSQEKADEPEASPNKVVGEVGQAKCFAKRRRPTNPVSLCKWDCIRQAFMEKIKPLLTTYSAHEDCFISKIVGRFCFFFFWLQHVSKLELGMFGYVLVILSPHEIQVKNYKP